MLEVRSQESAVQTRRIYVAVSNPGICEIAMTARNKGSPSGREGLQGYPLCRHEGIGKGRRPLRAAPMGMSRVAKRNAGVNATLRTTATLRTFQIDLRLPHIDRDLGASSTVGYTSLNYGFIHDQGGIWPPPGRSAG